MSDQSPAVVQYLYVHERGEAFHYPSARSNSSSARAAVRYLECVLTQAATLRLREIDCELVLASNIEDRDALGRTGRALLDRIEALGVRIAPTAYNHRPGSDAAYFVASRFVLDAILAATTGQPPDRQLWFTDVDCVWPDALRVFASAPPVPAIGCLFIPYGPDWVIASMDERGPTRRAVGAMAATMGTSVGAAEQLPPWIGGELLGGASASLHALAIACEEVDARLIERGEPHRTEEYLLSVVGALGLADFHDLSDVARRVWTGPRNDAPPLDDPLALGLWHLPAEKGLSMRRTANQLLRGRDRSLRRDLSDISRLARRFNVAGTGLPRRVRDDGWITAQRIADACLSVPRGA